MKQYTEKQYDDDLTLSNDEYDESYYSDGDDLFELTTDDESPISRLKSLVLSIDWEITDEVLLQFNEELLDLKGIWAGESINLVYLQALEKLSKYIYQNKADSHPSAIKLLLTFYYNLEKVVSSQDLSNEQKKETLLEDVKRFENFKRQIKQRSSPTPIQEPERLQSKVVQKDASHEDQLLTLKAIVLGIDWEITDQDLNDLRQEVSRLEDKFSESRPKLILLQGIGTLAAYIKVKKSNSHPDAFKVLQYFYESLEKIAQEPLSLEGEKSILFPAVEKFNAFKEMLGPTIGPDANVKTDDDNGEDSDSVSDGGEISPALSGVSTEEETGFQDEKEAMALGLNDSSGVISHINNFFGDSASSQVFLKEAPEEPEIKGAPEASSYFKDDAVVVADDKDLALQGVDVGVDDEDDLVGEQERAGKDIFASSGVAQSIIAGGAAAGLVAALPSVANIAHGNEEPEASIAGKMETIPPVDSQKIPAVARENGALDRESALKGVDVETDADDDSDELSLPREGEELAPALATMDEESLFSANSLDKSSKYQNVTDEIVDTIDGLFLANDGIPAAPGSVTPPQKEPAVDVKNQDIQNEELIGFVDWLKEDSKEEEVAAAAAVVLEDVQTAEREPSVTEAPHTFVPAQEDDEMQFPAMDFVEDQKEDHQNAFFAENDLEPGSKDGAPIAAPFTSFATDLSDTKEAVASTEHIDDVEEYFWPEEEFEKPDGVLLSGVFPEKNEMNVVHSPVSALFGESRPVEDEVVFELYEEKTAPHPATSQESAGVRENVVLGVGSLAAVGLIAGLTGGAAPGNKGVDGFADSSVFDAPQQPIEQGPLSDLQACIDALRIELNDTIIGGLLKEISALRQKWTDKPLEKSFLQLLSTITQHIDSYRYESSGEAYGLLVSVSQAMSSLKDDTLHYNQDVLLGETLKVLEWQQGMLFRQAVKKGKDLMFTVPLRTAQEGGSQSDAQKDFDDLLARNEGTRVDTLSPPHHFRDESATAVDLLQVSTVAATIKKEPSNAGHIEIARENIVDGLKQEIAALRQTIQMEIAELRKELIKH